MGLGRMSAQLLGSGSKSEPDLECAAGGTAPDDSYHLALRKVGFQINPLHFL